MCGIAGTVGIEYSTAAFKLASSFMDVRGPDGEGLWREGGVVLLHRRLSIIDLSEFAAQPMQSSCGRYIVVFNGEIFNYKELRKGIEGDYPFNSNSDTEVVLAYFAKFGPKALDSFRGMFSLAIWDKYKAELFIARDRLGVKPLYYASIDKGFAFASRPQALCALVPGLNRGIDKQALRYFMEAGYVPAPYSIFKGVKKLEPGCYLTVTSQGISQTKYWSIDSVDTDKSIVGVNEDSLLEELDSLINDSVRLRMVSDVPLGAFLSGGIDSTVVAAYMMKHSSEPVRTFTIGFQDQAFDESSYAASVAAHLGTAHTCEMLAVDDLLKLMPTFIKQYDEPFFDYSAFPVMAVSRLAKRSVAVSLSGDGGDEAFGGYHYYRMMAGLQQVHRLPAALRNFVGSILKHAPAQRVRWLARVLESDNPAPAYAFMRGVIKDATHIMKPSLLTSTKSLSQLFAERAALFPVGLSYAEIGMRLDMAYTLPDDYLQKVDVGSMAFSLEARDPLLDHTIIEWAAKLPLEWKLRGGINKYLLRKLAYRHVPREILDRPKMGFGVPMAQWLRGGLRLWGESLLKDDQAFDALELDAQAVRTLWNAHQANQLQAHTALWSVLVMLQFYRSQFQSE
ncbi:asparagine synthase (glutamine-hydrolyzing) [Limnohabitans curvus]|uniref:asparagine synthase (glutamine-hydrolyzing) n=2 Tax=Limnohabitans curvus TaxID=323423 RepID=A0A315G1N3_9BURK|nr:asparagine synthase (glutamine-hydrolyzing) [Limnohabitans curvus]